MDITTIIVACLSLFGTLVGSVTGVMTANKLTTYRIEQLEKKVDKHNTIIERVALLEQDNTTQWKRIDALRADLEQMKREIYGGMGK